ncbi:hypothetical protein Glove_365g254 [Diversispora epigaea]|uniref:Uncharacterized protein n=1 Tax=Diversispora epigaea TaxID=1348612 RepID=A0A397H813_9GLOM|nr:hypothetical protein Glove_365g254 [Diversispora epigaea]
MLLSITLTALSAVTASIIIPIFKYFELKEQRKQKNEDADESNNEPNNEEANIESSDSQSNELANTSVGTLGVHNECKNESKNDDGANATSKIETLPPLLKLSTSSNFNEEERFNNLNNKVDEILKRVETMRKYREHQRQKNNQ